MPAAARAAAPAPAVAAGHAGAATGRGRTRPRCDRHGGRPCRGRRSVRRAARPDDGITIAPFDPGHAHLGMAEIGEEPPMQEAEAPPAECPIIPPAPEQPPARMPRVEDFPPVAQRQLAGAAARRARRSMTRIAGR